MHDAALVGNVHAVWFVHVRQTSQHASSETLELHMGIVEDTDHHFDGALVGYNLAVVRYVA